MSAAAPRARRRRAAAPAALDVRDVSSLDAVPRGERAAKAAELVAGMLADGRHEELARWMRRADVERLGSETVVVVLGATRSHAGRLAGAHEELLGRLCLRLGLVLRPEEAREIVDRLTPAAGDAGRGP